MEYTVDDIEKIISFTSWNTRKKIDELLRIDCFMYTTLGLDSSSKERTTASKNSRKIYRAIKNLDYKIGNDFLIAMDRN
jgi:CRISPR/Cas system CSM-associated protein Csm2 small subunit